MLDLLKVWPLGLRDDGPLRVVLQLQLLVPQRFYVTQQAARGDRHVWGSLTRFIPPEVEACFERITPAADAAAAQATGPTPAGAAAFDIAARVRSVWQ